MSEQIEELLLKKIAKGASIVFFGIIISFFIGYVSRLVIARWLGAYDYGLISLVLAIFGIVTTVSFLGLRDTVTRFISFYKGKSDESKIRRVITESLKISLLIGIMFAIVLFIFSKEISLFFHTTELIPLIQIFAFAVPVFILLEMFVYCIRGFQVSKYKVYANDLMYPISKIFFIVILIFFGLGIIGVSIAYFIGMTLGACLAGYYLRKLISNVPKKSFKGLDKKLLKFAWPLLLINVVTWIMAWTDILMIGFFSDASSVGFYNAAYPTASMLEIFSISLAFLFMPILTELFCKKNKKELKNMYRTITKWSFFITLPISTLFILLPHSFIIIFFGPEYLEASISLSILALAFLFASIFYISTQTFISLGKPKYASIIWTIAAVSNIILNIILIPLFGISGASVAMLISIILGNIFAPYFIKKILKIRMFDKKILKPIFACIISSIIVFVPAWFFFGQLRTIFSILIFIVFLMVYFAMLLVIRCFEKDDMIIFKYIKKFFNINIDWLEKIVKKYTK